MKKELIILVTNVENTTNSLKKTIEKEIAVQFEFGNLMGSCFVFLAGSSTRNPQRGAFLLCFFVWRGNWLMLPWSLLAVSLLLYFFQVKE
jgi:hypothetical protein